MHRFIIMLGLVTMASTAQAQHNHNSSAMPSEVGNSTFAAIAEITQILLKDPDTNWQTVDISKLRDHLLDMDRVTMTAQVQMNTEINTVTFAVTGIGDTIASIQRMTQSHAPMLASTTGWTVTVQPMQSGVLMSVTPDNPSQLTKINALGFWGVMTIGAHHQAHHLAIATGSNPHH